MKIKFLKDFMATQSDDFRDLHAILIKRGDIVDVDGCKYNDSYFDMPKEQAQWLIDNGFAEEVNEPSVWKPKFGDIYYIAYPNGIIVTCIWDGCAVDENRFSNGAVFKTRTAVERYRDYLEAVNTVSQDEGFMRKNGGGFGWPVIEYTTNNPGVDDISERQHAGEFYFDTREHALNSAMNHTREWQTILNYDWSRE